MHEKNLSFHIILILTVLKLPNHDVYASNLFLEGDESILVVDSGTENNYITNLAQDCPLDLTIESKSLNLNNFSDQIYANNITCKLPLDPVKSLVFAYPRENISADSLNNTKILKIDEKMQNGTQLFISYRYLKFFFTKKNIYELMVLDMHFISSNHLIIPTNRSLLATKYMLLNIKNDVIGAIAHLFFQNPIGCLNLSHLKSFYDIENFLSCYINSIKISPAHVKVDSRVYFLLEDFVRKLYDRCNRYILCLSTNKLSRYIDINFKTFSLKGLLDTLIVLSSGCLHMKSDLKSIIFSILFFYDHGENKQICTMEFILKDMMIRVVSYIILYKLIQDDVTKTDHRKQLLYDKIENEIKKSFLMAFYDKDLTTIMSDLELLGLEIIKSKLEVKFDFSFIVILSKTFESIRHLRSILYDSNEYQSMLIKDELRASCKKLFDIRESIFDMIKIDA
ncbi:Peptidase aspartic [Nosema bombycis CQ1]|uniref:Peptidase aspartic n=1 Tax=Nosema bombycis (strain CQ1 / CVCC 102059) TaxID=578461 RepID=R0LZF2_NOSB1|nr:Peptidase aspartic [Nosema bombycis CQ1]|eukprot:EOB11189.1 Peptidase aspartic [Nosema bombycis CQ1]